MKKVTKKDSDKILRKLIASRGLKQNFIAKKMGLQKSAFYAYSRGRVEITADFAFEVAKVLDVSPEIFLQEEYVELLKK